MLHFLDYKNILREYWLSRITDKLIMLSFECDWTVFGGDFNLVCDVEKDEKDGAPTTHWKSKEEVSSLKEQFQLGGYLANS